MPESLYHQPDPLATLDHSVCAIAFAPGEPGTVLLTLNRPKDGLEFYDGFGGPLLAPLTDPEACAKTASDYLLAGTGIKVAPEKWCEIITLRGDTWEVGFYYVLSSDLVGAGGLTPEEIVSHEDPLNLPLNIMPTLRWLIPLVLDENVIKPLGMSGIKL